MRIIHIASGDLWAGAEVQLFHLALSLDKRDDVELLVVLLNDGQLAQELRDRKVDVNIIDESKYSLFKIIAKFYKLCRRYKPDVIHTHRVKENIAGGVVAWLTRCKSIRTVHGASEFSSDFKTRVTNFIDNFVACVFQHKVIAVSRELKDKLNRHCFSSKLDVIENCIDIEYVSMMSKKPIAYYVDKTQFNIAFVGRFVDVKRTDLFVKIAEDVNKRFPEYKIRFHMFGDGPLWEQTQDYVAQQRLDDSVTLAGFVDNSAPYIKQMNLLLFMSDHEGLPMTLLEAMVLNVPVMSRNLPTIKSVLCDGDCGYVCKSDTIHFFSNKIIEIINNVDNYRIVAEKAINRVENDYSIYSLTDKYINLYNLVIGKD